MTEQELTPAGDDNILPFQVDGLDVRGRAVQLGPMLNDILDRHDYPQEVSNLLARICVMTVLLGSSLKFEGRLIVQTQTDGPVSLLVVDYRTPGLVRAYANYDPEQVSNLPKNAANTDTALIGNGVMAMTIDQGAHTNRYQGVVALDGGTLDECACQYFRQSEQIPTIVKTSVAQMIDSAEDGTTRKTWRAGGIIAQFLPVSSERMHMGDLDPGTPPRGQAIADHEIDDAWNEAVALVSTIGDDELIDPNIPVERLLFRLFHENGVRIYPANEISAQCSCSREKMVDVFKGFSEEELRAVLADSEVENRFHAKCEFCSQTYEFEPEEFGL